MSTLPSNQAEQFAFEICKKSFFSLWSYHRPEGKNGKELCDIIVVCGPAVIIFSVKEITIKETGDEKTDWERWKRKAVEDSCRQIYGAERWLNKATEIIRNNGLPGIKLPAPTERRIHRVAVAFGGKNKVPLMFGDFGKGYVHVFDEISFNIILGELNTIPDFVKYLAAKEGLHHAGVEVTLFGAEEDLLALYLHQGGKFPSGHTHYIIEGPIWEKFVQKEEYKRKRKADAASYAWDGLIQIFSEDTLKGTLEFGHELNNSEKAIRIMAKEDRFCRRILGKAFSDFYLHSKTYRSRMVSSPSGVVYVFLARPHGTDRGYRRAELGTRCFIARGINPKAHNVVGIATEQCEPGKGFSLDLYYLFLPTWNKKLQNAFTRMQKDLGFFTKPQKRKVDEDEYPTK